jgi:hypothetical protein
LIPIYALSDRVILASPAPEHNDCSVSFLVKHFPSLECLLLGYLSATPKSQINLAAVKACLVYLDTALFSPTLLSRITKLGLYNAAEFLLKNTAPGQFSLRERLQIARALGKDGGQILELLTGGKVMSVDEDIRSMDLLV